ncbi:MAG: hypothetical protein LBC17_02075 [Lactobacillaceae bacterium]|jgi:hypothetical protein|nr:hypothetical protein [Lactobacillaceae bacterium]
MKKEFLNIIVHIYKEGKTQIIATRKTNSTEIIPEKLVDNYIKNLPYGKLPDGDQIAMRTIPIDKIVNDDPEWLCSKINSTAIILAVGR